MRNVQTQCYRNSDPVTSALAADHVNKTGLRSHQQRQAAAAVKVYPGHTSAEIAHFTGLCRFMLARRLGEAELAGAVRRGDKRQCAVSHLMAIVWYVGEGGL